MTDNVTIEDIMRREMPRQSGRKQRRPESQTRKGIMAKIKAEQDIKDMCREMGELYAYSCKPLRVKSWFEAWKMRRRSKAQGTPHKWRKGEEYWYALINTDNHITEHYIEA